MATTGESKSVQEFFYNAPEANLVQLVGDFTHWQSEPINMVKEPNGTWKAAVQLPHGSHRYRFLVDGQWSDDPESRLRVPNVFGSQDMVRQVGDLGETVAGKSGEKKASPHRTRKRA
jgi:1,4-alpha-glucan branching enzyme